MWTNFCSAQSIDDVQSCAKKLVGQSVFITLPLHGIYGEWEIVKMGIELWKTWIDPIYQSLSSQ